MRERTNGGFIGDNVDESVEGNISTVKLVRQDLLGNLQGVSERALFLSNVIECGQIGVSHRLQKNELSLWGEEL